VITATTRPPRLFLQKNKRHIAPRKLLWSALNKTDKHRCSSEGQTFLYIAVH